MKYMAVCAVFQSEHTVEEYLCMYYVEMHGPNSSASVVGA
jgi:hypothetical protein